MSGANPWSVKGIDPKVREAARDAARRQGLTLGEYLNQALAAHEATKDDVAELEPSHSGRSGHSGHAPQMPTQMSSQTLRSRAGRLPLSRHSLLAEDFETDEEWLSPQPTPLPRLADPVVRLTQKLEAIERRTQLAVTGLDRTVSTIDRSLLGLSQRVDDAEAGANDAADKVAEALEQFRIAHATLSGQLTDAETEAAESRRALENATATVDDVRAQLEARIVSAEASAREAEASATILAEQIAVRDEHLSRRVTEAEAGARSMVETAIAEARAAAEEAMSAAALEARAAGEEAKETAASITKNALGDIRTQQEVLAQRLASTEHAARQAAHIAISETRAARSELIERMERIETDAGARNGGGVALAELQAAQEILQRRIHECENGLRNVSADAVEEMRRMQAALSARIERVESTGGGLDLSNEALENLRAAQDQLAQRIDRSDQAAREATAGLRQSAGAAIADMRNAHLGLVARLKQVEDNGPPAVQDLQSRVEALAERIESAPIGGDADGRLEAALQQFAKRLDLGETKTAEIAGGVRTIEESMQRLAERLRQTEEAANSAIQRIENVAVVDGAPRFDAEQLAEGVRSMLEQRLGAMAQQTTQMLEVARAEIADQVGAALDGLRADELEAAIAEVNRRISSAERRQAQTIEAISIEIRRMSETVDRRLRGVESRNEDVAGVAVHEEIERTSKLLEHRLEEIERRDAAAFDRMGIEFGRLSDRFDERLVSVEGRSAQAIEQIGEQVARMAERFNQRQDQASRDVNDRIAGAEERMASRLSDAVQSLHQRVTDAEQRDLDELPEEPEQAYAVEEPMQQLQPDFAPPEPQQPYAPQPLAPPQPAPRMEHPHPMMDDDASAPDLIVEDIDIDLPQQQSHHLGQHASHHPVSQPREQLPPLHAQPVHAQAAHAKPQTHAYDADPFTDDLDDLRDLPPPPADDDDLWSDAGGASPMHAGSLADDLPPLHAEPPARRDDYLAAARRAAQAQAAEMTKGSRKKAKREDIEEGPVKGLRGPARIVLWGAAGALAITLAGAAFLLKAQPERAPEPAAPPAPDATVAAALPAPITESVFDEPPLTDPVQVGGALSEVAPPIAEAAIPQAAQPHQNQAPVAAAQTRASGAIRGASPRSVAAPVTAPRYSSLEQAATSGDAVAQYDLALQRLQAGVTPEAVDLLRRSATQGLAMAQYRLAKLYERGEGVSADLAQARQWTERAAAGGNRRAMHDLGVFFARGEGAPLDEQAAFRWFRQAAELGVTDSQYNLGVLYQQGRGVQANAADAMFWFLVAARNGDSDAVSRAQTLEGNLTQTQAEQARQRATAFRPRAASARANGEFGSRAWPAPARARS